MNDSAANKLLLEKRFEYNSLEHRIELDKLKALQEVYRKQRYKLIFFKLLKRIGNKNIIEDEYSLKWKKNTKNMQDEIVKENQETYRRIKHNREKAETEMKKLDKMIKKFPRLSIIFEDQLKSEPNQRKKTINPFFESEKVFPSKNFDLLGNLSKRNSKNAEKNKNNILRLPLGNSNWFLNDSTSFPTDEYVLSETLLKIHSNRNYSFSNKVREENFEENLGKISEEGSIYEASASKLKSTIVSKNKNRKMTETRSLQFPPLFYAVERIKTQRKINERNGMYMLDPIMRMDVERINLPRFNPKFDYF